MAASFSIRRLDCDRVARDHGRGGAERLSNGGSADAGYWSGHDVCCAGPAGEWIHEALSINSDAH